MVDDGPWLYCKLTNEPKGSGELKTYTYHIKYSNISIFGLYLTENKGIFDFAKNKT